MPMTLYRLEDGNRYLNMDLMVDAEVSSSSADASARIVILRFAVVDAPRGTGSDHPYVVKLGGSDALSMIRWLHQRWVESLKTTP
jgi:hypothetical protein